MNTEPTEQEIPTPRTDAQFQQIQTAKQAADFARTLERELTLLQTKLTEVEKALRELAQAVIDARRKPGVGPAVPYNTAVRIIELLSTKGGDSTCAQKTSNISTGKSNSPDSHSQSEQDSLSKIKSASNAAPEHVQSVSDSGNEGAPETDAFASRVNPNSGVDFVPACISQKIEKERNAALRDLAAEREKKSLYIMTDDNLRTSLEWTQAQLAAAQKALTCFEDDGMTPTTWEALAEKKAQALTAAQDDHQDFLAFMAAELAKFPCCHETGYHASTPPMMWPELIACIVKKAVTDATAAAQETIAQVTRERDVLRAKFSTISLGGNESGFHYIVSFGGGVGPDVWDNEIRLFATDIEDAIIQAKGRAEESGGWVFMVSQEDYPPSTREQLETQLNNLRNELSALRAELERKDAALEKCCRDIEFWNEVLDKEWRNFDGQLNPALNQARAALSTPVTKEDGE